MANWWEELPDLNQLGLTQGQYMFPDLLGGLKPNWTGAGVNMRPDTSQWASWAQPQTISRQQLMSSPWGANIDRYKQQGLYGSGSDDFGGGYQLPIQGSPGGYKVFEREDGNYDVRYIPDFSEYDRLNREINPNDSWMDYMPLLIGAAPFAVGALQGAGVLGQGAATSAWGIPAGGTAAGGAGAAAAGAGAAGLTEAEITQLIADAAAPNFTAAEGVLEGVGTGVNAFGGGSMLTDIASNIPSWLKSVVSGLPKNIADGVIANYVNNRKRDDRGQIIDEIAAQNQLRDLAPTARSNLQSTLGLPEAQQLLSRLVEDPTHNAGYNLATVGSNELSDLYTDPMANPIMQAVSRTTAENAARRSAVGRGLNSGSMPAEMQDALMTSLGGQFGNLAGGYSQGINAGTGFYAADKNATAQALQAAMTPYQAQTQRGTAAANATNAHLGAIAGIAPQAYQTQMSTNSAVSGQNALAPVVNAATNWAGDKLTSWLGGLF